MSLEKIGLKCRNSRQKIMMMKFCEGFEKDCGEDFGLRK
jgi:hypothetical protein